MSQWAATSLLDDYGVAADKVTVIPFGIRVPSTASLPARRAGGPARIAFVGTSLDRKEDNRCWISPRSVRRPT
jgi:hypothetical protein